MSSANTFSAILAAICISLLAPVGCGRGPKIGSGASELRPSQEPALAASGHRACVLKTDGAYCWGDADLQAASPRRHDDWANALRLVVRDNQICAEFRDAPTQCKIGTSEDATLALRHEPAHHCELGPRGVVLCAGDNGWGQLGRGDTLVHADKTAVKGLEGMVEVVDGDDFSCAKGLDERVHCWGSNTHDQLGHPREASSATPQRVLGLDSAGQLVGGHGQTCALNNGDRLACWGRINRGPSAGSPGGVPGPQPSSVSVAVDLGFANVAQVAVGREFQCVLDASGGVRCRGANVHGQCGDFGDAYDLTIPSAVRLPRPAKSIHAAYDYACVISTDNELYCWGHVDAAKSLFTAPCEIKSDPSCSPQRAEMRALDGPVGLGKLPENSAKMRMTRNGPCVLRDAQAIFCLEATTPTSSKPSRPVDWMRRARFDSRVVDYDMNAAYDYCTAFNGGRAECVGNEIGSAQFEQEITGIRMGRGFACALLEDETVECWGDDVPAASGRGRIAGVGKVLELVTGVQHTCVRTRGGEVWCWGQSMEVGNGSGYYSPLPTPVVFP